MSDRSLPWSLDAERSVLGAVLLWENTLRDVEDLITADDFFRDAHQRIFRAAQHVAAGSAVIDFVTVKERLAALGELDAVGGPVYLAGLSDGVPRSVNAPNYAAIVREKAKLRAIIRSANAMLADAYDAPDGDALAVIDRAEHMLFKLASHDRRENGFVHISAIVPGVMEQIEAWSTTTEGVSGIPSGFAQLDDITRGFQPGNLIVIGARPAVGKSAFALNIAQHAAACGHTAAIFSLEMSAREVGLRAIIADAKIDGHRVQQGRIHETEWTRLSKSIGRVSALPIYIDESPFVTSFEMRSRARKIKAEHGLGILIVDYTQLMIAEDKDRRENRTIELGGITRALKGLAKELNVPVLALAQLARKLEDRSNKTPMLSDLRESGSFEQDADMVVFLHRDYLYTRAADMERVAEVIISKHRNGRTGTIRVAWIPEETRFADLEPW